MKWVKISAVILLVYVHTAGLLGEVPRLAILNESIRAIYFHVPMWFTMMLIMLLSMIASIIYLAKHTRKADRYAVALANTGTVFCILGLVTGMIWARFTWGAFWHGDAKQNYSAIALMIYVAYFILRSSLENPEQKATFSAVYNIFAFFCLIPLLVILPRMESSMHPGNGGNPGFNTYDLDGRMRLIFYPAIIGWFLLALWISTQQIRLATLRDKIEEHLVN